MIAVSDISQKKSREKITMITSYDYMTASIADKAGIDMILVGDSLGMVFQGNQDTLNVSMADMQYHTKVVSKAISHSMVVADMPYGSYYGDPQISINNANSLISCGAKAVKIEGTEYLDSIEAIIKEGVPVVGHVGFTPQSLKSFGGYKVQGKTPVDKNKIINDARMLEDVGVFAVVIEMVTAELGSMVTDSVDIPVIGCGAGADTDGQVLVVTDILGLSEHKPKFAKQYVDFTSLTSKAIKQYKEDVEKGKFPSEEYFY